MAIGQVHAAAGWVVASAAPRLAARDRHDQAAVRRFRASLAAPDAVSFGIQPAGPADPLARPRAWLAEDAVPVTALGGTETDPGSPWRAITLVPGCAETGGARGLVQLVVADPPVVGSLRWGGRIRLDQAEFPELTEVSPPTPAPRRPRLQVRSRILTIEEPTLPWALAMTGDLEGFRASIDVDGFVAFEANLRAPGAAVIGVGERGGDAVAAALELLRARPDELVERALATWRRRWVGVPENPIVRRGLGYALGCCAAPVGDAVALVTDHRLLPLVWTRDAYFVARAFLAWWSRTGLGEARDLVRRHLRWLFEIAQRPEGWWARAHFANGARKDDVFQLDQQLYPLLELADYVDLTGDRGFLERWQVQVERVLEAIRARRVQGAPLYRTDETAADDPAPAPLLFATHVLLAHVVERLARLGIDAAVFLDDPDAVRRAARSAFLRTEPDGRHVFAYGTDLDGSTVGGHDANDFPLVLAPPWGFCRADDPTWRATVAAAFSARNPSFFPGAYGGLGSVHTPGSWPLGHIQARIAARILGDEAADRAATAALEQASFWDGALPEASDASTSEPISRPWFAWPGAALAALELGWPPLDELPLGQRPR